MESAISMFLDEEFTSNDGRLNDQSYEELGLICPKCRELVFFKPCIEGKRVAHFSHFKDTGEKCKPETKTNNNISKQDNDSESREQSLKKFQDKFEQIIERAIINCQGISDEEFEKCKTRGELWVDENKINIDLCLSWFNNQRKFIKDLAMFLYPNKKLSDIQRRVFLNIVDYLCVPASKNILTYMFYYVFSSLDKKLDIDNDSERVCSKIIKLIICVNWQEEYKLAKESLAFDVFKNEPVGKREILNFAKILSHAATELDKENERLKTSSFFGIGLYVTGRTRSCEEIKFQYIPGEWKKTKKGKIVFSKVKGRSHQELSICWQTDTSGQHLIFKDDSVIVATFSLLNNRSIQWKPLSEFNKLSKRIAIPVCFFSYDEIVSTSLEQFFLKWLINKQFAKRLSLDSRRLTYVPKLINLLLLYMAYAAERTEKFTEMRLEIDTQVSRDEVAKTFNDLISGLVGETPFMERIYKEVVVCPFP
jgi:hypothetical protein